MDVVAPHALALQIRCNAINKIEYPTAVRAQMLRAITAVDDAIAGAQGFHGKLDIVVLPEYFMTGHPAGDTLAGWRERAAIEMTGVEVQRLGEVVSKHGIYLAANAYEAIEQFPDIHFQTCFLVGPTGEVILKYRRLISMYAPSPYDVLQRYLDIFGEASLFPVADTPIGRIALIASEEILYPEIARAFAFGGAEIFLHSSSEAALKGLSPKNLAKRARAMENIAYVVSANSAGIEGGVMLPGSTEGSSQIVDYEGRVLLEAEAGESMNVVHELDVGALRRARRRVSMSNYPARLPIPLFASAYQNAVSPVDPDNLVAASANQHDAPGREFFIKRQEQAIQRLSDKKVI